jgi:membrane-associated protein
MELVEHLGKLLLHFNQENLAEFIKFCGVWTYLIMFAVIFCETGLVVTPFLPGDSLLFLLGAMARGGADGTDPLSVNLLFVLLSVAAIVGDTVNYWLGAYVGPRAFTGRIRFLKKEYLERTHRFYERYGGKTIILARFVPIVRTFAPFVAGIGAMNYTRFIVYNVVGGIAWVAIFLYGGYWLSHWLQEQGIEFRWVAVVIIVVSVLPMGVEFVRAKMRRSAE